MLTTNNVADFRRTICVCVFVIPHTCLTGVVHQDDLFEQEGRRRVQDAVDRPQESGPGLVVEDDDDTGGGQRGAAAKPPLNAPVPHKRVGVWEGEAYRRPHCSTALWLGQCTDKVSALLVHAAHCSVSQLLNKNTNFK